MSRQEDRSRIREFEERMRQDTVALRAEFLRLVPSVKVTAAAAELSRRGCGEVTPDALHSLLERRRIFSIRHDGQELIPLFQFDDRGRPLPVVHELLEIFAKYFARTDWDNALWFVAANDWLDGASPLELLLEEPILVKDAAEQAVLPHIE
jgi:hypothetical protein